MFRKTATALAAALMLTSGLADSLRADDAMPSPEATLGQIEQMMGGVPGFVKAFPQAGLPGAWSEYLAIEASPDTAIPPKYKALISLAVSAQIPCNYCVWADTQTARANGATDEEIGEAVAIAAVTRHWSTVFNGLGIDFDTFKREMSGDFSASK